MQSLAERLIAEESRADKSAAGQGRAAFRVCEKLRRPLCTCAGAVGFRSLLRRALNLAKADAPWLEDIRVDDDGAFHFSGPIEAQLGTDAAVKGGAALLEQLLTLLVTFIGETLTQRLIHDVWPAAATRDSKPQRNRNEKAI